MDALVSILVPNYNCEKFLAQTLDSVRLQTYPNFECIIVDDHSQDASLKILDSYARQDPRFKFYRRPENLSKGSNNCRNFAFQSSNGAFINWFDSDDIMHPEFIEQKLRYLLNNPGSDAVVSKLASLDNSIPYDLLENWLPGFSDLKVEYLTKDIHFHTAGPMFRRNSLKGKNLFAPELKVGQEKEFFYRLILQGLKFSVLDNRLTLYRSHSSSILGSFKGKHFSFDAQQHVYFMLRVLLKTGSFSPDLNLFIKKKISLLFKVIKIDKKWKELPGLIYLLFLFMIFKKKELPVMGS